MKLHRWETTGWRVFYLFGMGLGAANIVLFTMTSYWWNLVVGIWVLVVFAYLFGKSEE